MKLPRLFATLVALAVVLSACSSSADPTTTPPLGSSTTTGPPTTSLQITTTSAQAGATTLPPTSSTTSSTVASTSTTEPAPSGVSPINGLPVDDPSLLDRRTIAVKIDNHPRARPQSGVQNADLMIELLVEGGFTRFIAVFHSNDSTYLGPVRSGRPTDSTLLAPFDGVFAISGAQAWVSNLLVGRGLRLLGEGSGDMFRISSRVAPHNLYANTESLRAAADARSFDDEFGAALYEMGPWVESGERATAVRMQWSNSTSVRWRWEEGEYVRYQGAPTHDWITSDGSRAPIAADTLVVIEAPLYTATPPEGVSGSSVPALDTVGSGNAYIFHRGEIRQGRWTRGSITEGFTLVDESGDPMGVPAGRLWLHIFPAGREITWA